MTIQRAKSNEFKNQLKDISLKEKHLIKKRQNELSKVKDLYNKNESALKQNNQIESARIRNDLKSKEDQFLMEHQEKLKMIQKEHKEQEKKLESLHQSVKMNEQNDLDNFKERFSDKSTKIQEKSSKEINDLYQDFENQKQKAEMDLDHQKYINDTSKKIAINDMNASNSVDLQNISDKHLNESKHLDLRHKAALDANQREIEFKIDKQNKEYENQKLNSKNGFEDQLKRLKKLHQQALKQEVDTFNSQYKNLKEAHELAIKEFENRSNEYKQKIIASNAKSKNTYQERAEDYFYSPSIINPAVFEDQDSYKVSIKIPEHERDQVLLHAIDRKIRLTMGRKVNEELLLDDGSLNKTSRSENISKELMVDHILNAKSISKTYKDGILTYTIAKK